MVLNPKESKKKATNMAEHEMNWVWLATVEQD